ncbi:MAG: efflux RND transporter periplasmic adaptor subunit [Pseudomonadota bacterium]
MRVRITALSLAASACFASAVWAEEICTPQKIQGFTEPAAIVDVASREPGLLAQMHVMAGERVQAGKILAELDKTLALTDVAAAKSRADATGRIQAAEARATLARNRLAEIQKLRRSGAARPLEVVAAEADAAITEAELKVAKDDRTGLIADLARAEARLTLLDIVAPIDGVVHEIHRETGEFVGASGDPRVLTLLDDGTLEIDFFAPFDCVRLYETGDRLDVVVGESAAQPSSILELASEVDAATGLRRIRVSIDNPNSTLLSGQRAALELPQEIGER